MVTLVEVDAGDARLGRLLQLYMHEWSGKIPVAIGPDALFTYRELERFGSPAAGLAVLFLAEGVPVGFALALPHGDAWSVEELFVIAGARRKGVGLAAARGLFAMRPGRWTLTVRPENPEALAFWRKVGVVEDERVEVGDDGVARTRLSYRG
jgi:predicted acetyltransferase